MKKSQLVEEVLNEMSRVWGGDGFDGTAIEYEWLLRNFNIKEEEDVRWQLILQHESADLPAEELDNEEVMRFLEDDEAVVNFLMVFLSKYKSSAEIYLV